MYLRVLDQRWKPHYWWPCGEVYSLFTNINNGTRLSWKIWCQSQIYTSNLSSKNAREWWHLLCYLQNITEVQTRKKANDILFSETIWIGWHLWDSTSQVFGFTFASEHKKEIRCKLRSSVSKISQIRVLSVTIITMWSLRNNQSKWTDSV